MKLGKGLDASCHYAACHVGDRVAPWRGARMDTRGLRSLGCLSRQTRMYRQVERFVSTIMGLGER